MGTHTESIVIKNCVNFPLTENIKNLPKVGVGHLLLFSQCKIVHQENGFVWTKGTKFKPVPEPPTYKQFFSNTM